jgi:hypothetical protein
MRRKTSRIRQQWNALPAEWWSSILRSAPEGWPATSDFRRTLKSFDKARILHRRQQRLGFEVTRQFPHRAALSRSMFTSEYSGGKKRRNQKNCETGYVGLAVLSGFPFSRQ